MKRDKTSTSSSSTKLELTKIDLVLKANPLDLTEDETKLVGNIIKRFDEMRSARVITDRFWQIAQLQFEAQYIPYSDGRARSNVPLEWAIIELFVSEALARESTPIINATGESDISKAELLKRIEAVIRKKNGIKKEMYKNEYITAIFGTSYYLTAYNQSQRVIEDLEFDELGQSEWKKKMLKESRIVIKALDPRNVYLDNRTIDFEYDNDQVYIDYITPEQLQSLKYNEDYKNIDKVGVGSKVDQAFFTQEERGRSNDGLVEFMYYWNKQADKYVILANRSIPIWESPLPYSHKLLPIVPRAYGYNPLSKMGRGLCEALLNFKSNINSLHEMIMDGIRRSNNSMFVIGNGLTFDGDSFGFDNTLKKANGSLDDTSFREIRGQQPNNAIFSYLQELLKEIAIFVGIDPSAIVGQASSTAFETAVKQETGLKRVNVALMNRDMALEEVYKRHIANIMQFFPIKDANGILDIDESGKPIGTKEYPKILLENEKVVNETFVKSEGKFPFEVTPELIRGNFDIEVNTNFNSPTLKQLKLQRYQDFVRTATEYSNAIISNPELAKMIPLDKFIKDLAFDFDIDIESMDGIKGSITKEKEKLLADINQMTGALEGLKAMGQTGGSAPALPTETPEEGVRQNVGGISTPNTPDIAGTNPQLTGLIA